MRRLILACCLMSSAAFASEPKEMTPLLAVRGKQILADDFSGPSLDSRWTTAKGKWQIKDGVLTGVEVASDMHAATLRTDLKHTDAVYQFDFSFAPEGKTIHFSLNGAPGHLCRVSISPGGFQVRKDASKKDAADKAVLLDSCKMTFEPGKTYTMLVECVGGEIVARVDDKHFAFGEDAKVSKEKTNFGFPIAGAGSIDNVKVWEATANPEWAKTKAKLAASHPEKMTPPARPAKKPAAATAGK